MGESIKQGKSVRELESRKDIFVSSKTIALTSGNNTSNDQIIFILIYRKQSFYGKEFNKKTSKEI